MTADSIADRYLVGEARLLDYARRGNLPLRRLDDGTTVFDESVCARFFRPRHGAVSYREPKGEHMGILGVTPLGADPKELVLPLRRRKAIALGVSESGEHPSVGSLRTTTRKAAAG